METQSSSSHAMDANKAGLSIRVHDNGSTKAWETGVCCESGQ